MKSVSAICALALSLLGTAPARAATNEPGAIVVDVVLVRPACLVATIVGSAFFVVALPVAAASRSVHSSANALVVKPAAATFTRPLGDWESLAE